MNDLRQVAILGLGLIGGSISLEVLGPFTHSKVVRYARRSSTRNRAGQLTVAGEEQAGDAGQI